MGSPMPINEKHAGGIEVHEQQQAGLEVTCCNDPIASPPAYSSLQATPSNLPEVSRRSQEHVEGTYAELEGDGVTKPNEKVRRSLCGLRPVVFWFLLALIVILIAGAIGGGVGAALSMNSSDNSGKAETGEAGGQSGPPPSASTSHSYPASSSTLPIVTPSATPPASADCSKSFSSPFTLHTVNLTRTNDRDEGPISCNNAPCPPFNLKDGVLRLATGEIEFVSLNYGLGYAANPWNAGAMFDGGWSVCANRTIMLGGSAVWWRCPDGGFYYIQQSRNCYPAILNVVT